MRLFFLFLLTLISFATVANAQSVMENLPQTIAIPPLAPPPAPLPPAVKLADPAATKPADNVSDPYTVSDVSVDVTADTAAHARDQALTQAEHSAFEQLCARLNTPDTVAKISDDAVAALVQSFDTQSEKISAKRYIGVFTIHFKAASLQKKLGKYLNPGTESPDAAGEEAPPASTESVTHAMVSVATASLADWAQIRKRLSAVPQVTRIDVIDLARGVSHIDIAYTGDSVALENALAAQGFSLRQTASDTVLTDNNAATGTRMR